MPNTSAAPVPGQAPPSQNSRLSGTHTRRLFHLPKRCHARVELLSGEVLWLPYEKETTTMLELFSEACKFCGITEPDYFGLTTHESDGDWYQFVDLSEKVSKFKRKRGALSKKEGDHEKSPLFHFRLANYVPCHVLPRDRGTRRHYYLQLRCNVRESNLLQNEDQLVSLVLYALQADFGAFGPHLTEHLSESAAGATAASSPVGRGQRYFDPERYFPRWMIEKFGEAYFLTHVPPLHAGLGDMSRSEAEFHFIQQCSAHPSASYNMHVYRLRQPRTTGASFAWLLGTSSQNEETSKSRCDTVWMGISPTGLELFERAAEDTLFRTHVSTIAWHEICKLRFRNSRLEVRVLVDSGARSESCSRRPTAASLHVDHLIPAMLSVRGDALPVDPLLPSPSVSAIVRHSTLPSSALADRGLMFCAESTAQCSHILELTKLQHLFQLKASLRAPISADALESAERSRYREALVLAKPTRNRERSSEPSELTTTTDVSIPLPTVVVVPPKATGEDESGVGTLETGRDSPSVSADSAFNSNRPADSSATVSTIS